MQSSNPTNISFDFTYDGIEYTFFLERVELNILHFKISRPLDPNYWQSKLKYPDFQDKYPFIFLSEERFFEYIVYCIESKEFEMKVESGKLKLQFTFETGRGRFVEKINFEIIFDQLTGDVKENLSDMASYVKKIENQYDSFKNSIEVKFADLEEKMNLNIKNFMDQMIEKNKKHQEEITIDIKNFIINEQRKLDIKRLDISNEFSLNSNQVRYFNNFSFGGQPFTQIYPKFLNPNSDKISVLNDNRTIEKLQNTAWQGVRCEEISSIPGIYQFSIRIDKTDNNCYIMFGYCLNTQNGANGYYNGNCLANFNLNNGQIYCPSIAVIAANNFKGLTGMIISATIDTYMKVIYFHINGFPLAAPRSIRLNDEDISKICPCVDIYTLGDKVSIVKI